MLLHNKSLGLPTANTKHHQYHHQSFRIVLPKAGKQHQHTDFHVNLFWQQTNDTHATSVCPNVDQNMENHHHNLSLSRLTKVPTRASTSNCTSQHEEGTLCNVHFGQTTLLPPLEPQQKRHVENCILRTSVRTLPAHITTGV